MSQANVVVELFILNLFNFLPHSHFSARARVRVCVRARERDAYGVRMSVVYASMRTVHACTIDCVYVCARVCLCAICLQ